jgi:hypothetical protein
MINFLFSRHTHNSRNEIKKRRRKYQLMAKEESVTLTGHVTATPFKVNIIGWNALLVYFRF